MSNADVVIAVVGFATTLMLAGAAALWKLATMLAEVRTTVRAELRHNGGGSTKDYARSAAQDVEVVRVGVEYANSRIDELERKVQHGRDEMDAARRDRSLMDGQRNAEMAAMAHDVRNIRIVQAVLVDHIDRIDKDRLTKEAEWYEAARHIPGFDAPKPRGIERLDVPKQRGPEGDDASPT